MPAVASAVSSRRQPLPVRQLDQVRLSDLRLEVFPFPSSLMCQVGRQSQY
jgi:hypothetical protein